jgi:hypothetical protein
MTRRAIYSQATAAAIIEWVTDIRASAGVHNKSQHTAKVLMEHCIRIGAVVVKDLNEQERLRNGSQKQFSFRGQIFLRPNISDYWVKLG